jgi:hypothetical protein
MASSAAREKAAQGAAGWLVRKFGLRFPGLFLLFAALFGIDLFVPDVIPFADEVGLALLTLLFGLWRSRRPPGAPAKEDPTG